MPERRPDPSAPTSQFQAFIEEGRGPQKANPRVSTSTIAIVAVVAVLVVIAIIAAVAL